MKKNILSIMLAFALVVLLAACGGGKASDDKGGEAPKAEAGRGETKTDVEAKGEEKGDGTVTVGEEFTLGEGQYTALIEDISVVSDIEGKDAINVKYHVTNGSKEDKMLLDMFVLRATQDGKDLLPTILHPDNEDPNKRSEAFQAIPPGENSGLDELTFELSSDSDVVFIITSIEDAFKGIQFTITVPIPKG